MFYIVTYLMFHILTCCSTFLPDVSHSYLMFHILTCCFTFFPGVLHCYIWPDVSHSYLMFHIPLHPPNHHNHPHRHTSTGVGCMREWLRCRCMWPSWGFGGNNGCHARRLLLNTTYYIFFEDTAIFVKYHSQSKCQPWYTSTTSVQQNMIIL